MSCSFGICQNFSEESDFIGISKMNIMIWVGKHLDHAVNALATKLNIVIYLVDYYSNGFAETCILNSTLKWTLL